MYLKKNISIHKNLINIIKIKLSDVRINEFNAKDIKSVQKWCQNYCFRKNDEIIILVRIILIYHFARMIILIRMISELSFL